MKNLIIVLSVFLTVITVASAQVDTKNEAQKITYACPMHPDEISLTEGGCSKCGMKMVKTTERKYNHAVKGSQASSEIVTKYVCTMDGTTSDKPGNCPKCGMEMTKEEAKKATYACPMHPDEISLTEGSCSKCGMKMVKTTERKYNHAVKGSQASSEIVTKYICTMDGATSDKPGKCPKCGMKMTEKEVQKTTYTCPMHPEEVSLIEGGCSKCGMKMVKTTKLNHDTAGKGQKTSTEVITKYVCTMDGATSDKPGKCSKCGMEMTKKESPKK
jgi:nitrite reductase/ring-hydroxylating ferredoxin subunit